MGVIAVIAVLLIALAWFFWPAKARHGPDVDNAELEEAEREVQEASNEESVRDWGPGTGQKPLP
jgi:beta-lactam-binding protein with PASTA domain